MRFRFLPIFLGLICLALQPAPGIANPMSAAENFVDRPGGDYHSYNAGSAGQCATSCATVGQCKAYTYVRSTGVCWMKDSVPPSRADNCCISGVKLMGDEEVNFDRPGSDIKPGFPVVTSDQCETACRNDLNCRAYTFVKPGVQADSAMCWLKNRRPAKVPNNCCISGVRLRDPIRVPPASGNLQVKP